MNSTTLTTNTSGRSSIGFTNVSTTASETNDKSDGNFNDCPQRRRSRFSELPFGTTEIIITASILLPLCVFGTVANIITITVIAKASSLKTTFYLLILSLSISDLVSALISPLALYRLTWGFDYWKWTTFLCIIYWATDIWTSCVTSLHILMFSVFRFISIQWPHLYSAFTLKRTKISICAVWLITCGCGFVPLTFWIGVNRWMRGSGLPGSNLPSCSLTPSSIEQLQLFSRISYPILFYIPLLMIVVFSLGIFLKIYLIRKRRKTLRGSSTKQESDAMEAKRRRKENFILLQLGLIAGSFVIGYIPRTAYHFVTLDAPSIPPKEYWRFTISEYIAVRVSECFNPIFYVISSSKMRKETKKMFKSVWKRLNCKGKGDVASPRTTTTGTSTLF